MAKPRTTREGLLDLLYEQKLPIEVMLKAYLLFIGGTCKRTGRPFAVIRLDTLQTELRLNDRTPNEIREVLNKIGAEAGSTPNKNPRYSDCPGYYLNWLAGRPPEVTGVTEVTEVTSVTTTPSETSGRLSSGESSRTSDRPLGEQARVATFHPPDPAPASRLIDEARSLARCATLPPEP